MAEDDDDLTLLTQPDGAAPTSSELNYLPGDIVDSSYQLRKLLGRGGMGVVFAAYHTGLKRDYALKILANRGVDAESWSRFQVEAKALARLAHPSIVGIHNMGVDKGRYPYYVMDLLPGENLGEAIHNQGRLSEPLVISLFIDIADALKSAHAKGIIHRDLKPSNLMVLRDPDRQITGLKLVDFGIARLSRTGLDKQSQTATGAVFGTPFYMSPEQCQGERVDERSDIYSLGCTIFEALSGRPPFVGENAFSTFMMHQTAPIPRLNEDGETLSELDTFMTRMLAKKPSERFQTMEQVEHALMRIKSGKSIAPQAVTISKLSSAYDVSQITRAINEPHAEEQPESGHKLLLPLIISGLVVSLLVGIAVYFLPGLVPGKNDSTGVRSKDSSRGTSKYLGSVKTAASKVDRKAQSKDESAVKAALDAGEHRITAADKNFMTNLLGDDITANDLLVKGVVNPSRLRAVGATPEEIKLVQKYNWEKAFSDEGRYGKLLNAFVQNKALIAKRSADAGFILTFPTAFRLGYISVNGAKPILAPEELKLGENDSLTLYLNKATDDCPQVLEKFGPDGLTGLECVFRTPANARPFLEKMHRLKNLSFFNSLGKCLPTHEIWDESNIHDTDLPWIDRLRNIESLGLCGKELTAQAIIKMKCLHRLKALRLKRIPGCAGILPEIAKLDNIQELWIIGSDLTDKSLKELVPMKNLSTLRIRRSALTPASLSTFKSMRSLKHLIIDRPFTDAQKARFKKELPDCQFEPVLDTTYWDTYFVP